VLLRKPASSWTDAARRLEADFPDRFREPVDAACPPYAGRVPPEHRLGPWQPIQTQVKLNQAAVRTGD